MSQYKTIKMWIQKEETKGIFNNFCNAIIRPPRVRYLQELLGSKTMRSEKKTVLRHDYWKQFENYKFPISLFVTTEQSIVYIIYLHGNSSSRLQALSILQYLPSNFALICFDFIGCGISQRLNTFEEIQTCSIDYISLGNRESRQAEEVVQWTRKIANKQPIVMWGRSMGASTIIRCKGTQINILDSPYQSVKRVCKDIAYKQNPKFCPSCIFNCVFQCMFCKVRSDIKKKALFDINQLQIGKDIKNIQQYKKILFIAGDQDNLINSQHSFDLFKNFRGHKQLLVFKGTHNSKRPAEVIKRIIDFIRFGIQSFKLNK